MANTGPTQLYSGVRRWTIDTDATSIELGSANEGTVGSFAIHLYSNSAAGNGITVEAQQQGASTASLGWISVDYQHDSTDVAAGTKITAAGRYYVRSDQGEVIRLSFEIASGSWDVVVSSGAG